MTGAATTLSNESPETAIITAIEQNDPVVRLLRRISSSFLTLWLVCAVASFLYFFLLAAVAGRLHIVENLQEPTNPTLIYKVFLRPIDTRIITQHVSIVGFLNNLGELYIYLVTMPISLAGLVWQPLAISTVIRKFRENMVIKGLSDTGKVRFRDETSFNDYVSRLGSLLSAKWIPIGITIALLLVNLALLFPKTTSGQAPNPIIWRHALSYGLRPFELLAYDIAYYGALMMAARAIIFTIWSTNLFKYFELSIHPLNPDGSGGLGSLGSYLSRTGYVIGAYGMIMLINSISSQASWLTMPPRLDFVHGIQESLLTRGTSLLLYILIAPISFFVPLQAGHRAMLRAKEAELKRIAKKYDSQYEQITTGLDSQQSISAEHLGEETEALTRLQSLAKLVEQYPTWPLRARYTFRFVGSSFSPVFLAVLPSFLDIVYQKLTS